MTNTGGQSGSCPGGPYYIGSVAVPRAAALAPMAGIADLPFRLICKARGAGLVYTEMVSAKAIIYNNGNTMELLKTHPNEHPVAVQLFGSEPEVLAEAAGRIRDLPFDIVDINCGCPAQKIVRNGEGSALMRSPALIGDIVRAVVKTAGKPVTVKLRKGYGVANAVEAAKAAEEGGASAVCVHPRLRGEFYAGTADMTETERVKRAVRIPVIASGDITRGADALRVIKETGCDGVMIGRAARGNPWVFEEVNAALNNQEPPQPPGKDCRVAGALEHARLHIALKGEKAAIEMRKHLCWYIKGIRGASQVKELINTAANYEDFRKFLFLL